MTLFFFCVHLKCSEDKNIYILIKNVCFGKLNIKDYLDSKSLAFVLRLSTTNPKTMEQCFCLFSALCNFGRLAIKRFDVAIKIKHRPGYVNR